VCRAASGYSQYSMVCSRRQAWGAASRVERVGVWVRSTWRPWLGLRAWLWPRCIAGELALQLGRPATAIQGRAELAVGEVGMERAGTRTGGLGGPIRAPRRRGPGVAVRGICEYTIRGGKVQGRRPIFIRGRGYQSRDDCWFRVWLVLAAVGALFVCIVVAAVVQGCAAAWNDIAAGIGTPTPAAEPAAWGLEHHQQGGEKCKGDVFSTSVGGDSRRYSSSMGGGAS